jgi:high-affinity Fe2+/Pb2+ permease
MPYEVYRLIHFTGIFMLVLAYGALAVQAMQGLGKDAAGRKMAVITHGVGMFLALLGGFGLLARLQIHWPWPGWVIVKVVIWILLGAGIGLVRRKQQWAPGLWWLVITLGVVAAYFAGMKPF